LQLVYDHILTFYSSLLQSNTTFSVGIMRVRCFFFSCSDSVITCLACCVQSLASRVSPHEHVLRHAPHLVVRFKIDDPDLMRVSKHIFNEYSTKAFDTISWEYLFELLQRKGFLPKWRNWISLIVTSSSSAVRLNGKKGAQIKHRRGLRQGDPLSPFLFILAIDSLQYIIQTTTEEGLLSPLRCDGVFNILCRVIFLNN
jgi:hypothetical protein